MNKKRLNKRFDKIKEKEQKGLLKHQEGSRIIRKFKANKLAVFGLILFFAIILATVFAFWLTPYDPLKTDLRARLESPSPRHLMGTDKLGRDVFSRVLYGGRISILVGLGSALGAAIIGVALGCYGGYVGGWFDKIALRISELFISFPRLILVLLLVSIVGPSLWNLILIFILSGWCSVYRQTRAKMLSLREEEYVQALKAFSLNSFVIAFKHILPNALGPILVNISLSTAMFILQETALSYLGLGVPLNIPTWGNIINSAQDITVLKEYWWLWLPVGIIISIFVLSVNFIGDGLRDSSDPTQQG